jgi:translation elongation factor aEF-1 beta
MAKIIVTFRLLPENPESNIAKIEEEVKEKIKNFAGEEYNQESDLKITQAELAFGLKSLDIKAILEESKGSTDSLEEEMKNIKEVRSVEVTDVRRIIG